MLVLVGVALAAREANLYYVQNFVTGGCGTSADTLEYTDNEVGYLNTIFSAWIPLFYWDEVNVVADEDVEAAMWVDVSLKSWGADDANGSGADSAEISFISSHGESWCTDVGGGKYRVEVTTGSPTSGECVPEASAGVGLDPSILLGGTEVYDAVLSTCKSGQKCA